MTATIWFCALGWVLGWWAAGRPRRVAALPAAPPTTAAGAPVTVVVPARDEERSLGHLLDDLARCRPPGCRVVVVDDHSTDRTAEIAGAHDYVELRTAPPLPPGWTGKSWACHVGARDATAGTLVFLDADVRVRPGALDRLLAEQRRRGGLLSTQPWHQVERPYEHLSALFNLVAVMGTGVGSRSGCSAAFGPVLITSVQDYRRIGGHAAVRDQIVDDVALARAYRRCGLGVEVLLGDRSLRFRMYPAGPAQLVEGWTKNFATGAGTIRPVRLAAVVVWITALGSAAGVLLDAATGDVPLAAGAAVYGLFTAQLLVLLRRVGRFGPVTAVLFPLLVAVFLLVFARSMWRTYVRRQVRWRGRAIGVGTTRS